MSTRVTNARWTLPALLLVVGLLGADRPPLSPGERSVRALERSWLDAYEQLDTLAMDRIVADDFLITFPDGSNQTKGQILSSLRSARRRAPTSSMRFRTENVSSRAYGNTVILTGTVVTSSTRNGRAIEERSRYTDTYVERGGRWQVVASHLSNAPADGGAPDGKRFVRNHTLVSRELPRMSMSVDPRLEYVGVLEFDLKQVARVERHVFAARDEKGRPSRMLVLQFESMLPAAKGTYSFGLENPTRLGAHDYQTQTGIFSFDEAASARPGAEAERTRAYLKEKGWDVAAEDFLVVRYARIVDAAKRSELIVFYYENLRLLDRTRRDLEPGGMRARETAALERDVAARARGSFTIRDASD